MKHVGADVYRQFYEADQLRKRGALDCDPRKMRLAPHQKVVQEIAGWYAARAVAIQRGEATPDKHEPRGMVVWHNTGSGKTVTATAIMRAFWETDYEIYLVTSVENSEDNSPLKYAENMLRFFPDFVRSLFPEAHDHETLLGNLVTKIGSGGAARSQKSVQGARVWRKSFVQFAHQVLREYRKQIQVVKSESDWTTMARKGAVIIIDEAQNMATGPEQNQRLFQFLSQNQQAAQSKILCFVLSATPGKTIPEWLKILNIVRPANHRPFTPADAQNPDVFRGLISYVDITPDTSRYAPITIKLEHVGLGPAYSTVYLNELAKMKHELYSPEKPEAYLKAARERGDFLDSKLVTQTDIVPLHEFPTKLVVPLDGTRYLVSLKVAKAIYNMMTMPGKQYVYTCSPTTAQILRYLLQTLGYKCLDAKTTNAVSTHVGGWGNVVKSFFARTNAEFAGGGKRGNFIDYTQGTDERLVRLFNERLNARGRYVKIFIATKKHYEGLDLQALRGVHILEPMPNRLMDKQLVGRGSRNCSHRFLPPNERTVTVVRYLGYISNKVLSPRFSSRKNSDAWMAGLRRLQADVQREKAGKLGADYVLLAMSRKHAAEQTVIDFETKLKSVAVDGLLFHQRFHDMKNARGRKGLLNVGHTLRPPARTQTVAAANARLFAIPNAPSPTAAQPWLDNRYPRLQAAAHAPPVLAMQAEILRTGVKEVKAQADRATTLVQMLHQNIPGASSRLNGVVKELSQGSDANEILVHLLSTLESVLTNKGAQVKQNSKLAPTLKNIQKQLDLTEKQLQNTRKAFGLTDDKALTTVITSMKNVKEKLQASLDGLGANNPEPKEIINAIRSAVFALCAVPLFAGFKDNVDKLVAHVKNAYSTKNGRLKELQEAHAKVKKELENSQKSLANVEQKRLEEAQIHKQQAINNRFQMGIDLNALLGSDLNKAKETHETWKKTLQQLREESVQTTNTEKKTTLENQIQSTERLVEASAKALQILQDRNFFQSVASALKSPEEIRAMLEKLRNRLAESNNTNGRVKQAKDDLKSLLRQNKNRAMFKNYWTRMYDTLSDNSNDIKNSIETLNTEISGLLKKKEEATSLNAQRRLDYRIKVKTQTLEFMKHMLLLMHPPKTLADAHKHVKALKERLKSLIAEINTGTKDKEELSKEIQTTQLMLERMQNIANTLETKDVHNVLGSDYATIRAKKKALRNRVRRLNADLADEQNERIKETLRRRIDHDKQAIAYLRSLLQQRELANAARGNMSLKQSLSRDIERLTKKMQTDKRSEKIEKKKIALNVLGRKNRIQDLEGQLATSETEKTRLSANINTKKKAKEAADQQLAKIIKQSQDEKQQGHEALQKAQTNLAAVQTAKAQVEQRLQEAIQELETLKKQKSSQADFNKLKQTVSSLWNEHLALLPMKQEQNSKRQKGIGQSSKGVHPTALIPMEQAQIYPVLLPMEQAQEEQQAERIRKRQKSSTPQNILLVESLFFALFNAYMAHTFDGQILRRPEADEYVRMLKEKLRRIFEIRSNKKNKSVAVSILEAKNADINERVYSQINRILQTIINIASRVLSVQIVVMLPSEEEKEYVAHEGTKKNRKNPNTPTITIRFVPKTNQKREHFEAVYPTMVSETTTRELNQSNWEKTLLLLQSDVRLAGQKRMYGTKEEVN